MKIIGVDIGSQKCMMVADDADIVLTDTGSIHRPTLVSFYGRSRLVGEEAAPQIAGDSTISLLNLLAGKAKVTDSELSSHQRFSLTSSSSGLIVEVSYCDKKESFSITAVLALFISKLYKRAVAVYGEDIGFSFALPPCYELSIPRAIKEACQIANIDVSKLSFVDATDCIITTYHRKLQALKGTEKTALEGKKTILIEVGHTQSTIVLAEVSLIDGQLVPTKLGFATDASLGALYFDFTLFKHFAAICKKQHNTEIVAGTKKAQRLLFACERARKLLSQLPEAKITVENLTDVGDVNFTVRREDFYSINASLIEKFKNLIQNALKSANIENANDVSAVEIVGGGVRMPAIQTVITSLFVDSSTTASDSQQSLPLGAKFDDASVALGAALITTKALATVSSNGDTTPASPAALFASQLPDSTSGTATVGLSTEEIEAAAAREKVMQAMDAELEQVLAARNTMESFILEMRSSKRRKHGDKIDSSKLDILLNEYENWMYDNTDGDLDLMTLNNKGTELRKKVQEICTNYFAAVETDRLAVEKALENEFQKAEAEKQMNGGDNGDGDNDDHDNRKLRKPDRMRMVVKNKEEGTELFKGGNYRPAAARYHKALSHCAKFFDLTPDDEIEVKAIKVTLFLNIASCYLKMENWDITIRNCNDALEIESNNIKGLFRRACAYEGKKEYEKALIDLKLCQEYNDVEDKQVTKAVERIKKEMQKDKEKEKKMWGKAFA